MKIISPKKLKKDGYEFDNYLKTWVRRGMSGGILGEFMDTEITDINGNKYWKRKYYNSDEIEYRDMNGKNK